MRRIIWLDSAKLDLIDIRAYYSEKASTKVAGKLLQRIYELANKLADQPLMGVTTMDDDILEWHIPGLSYTLPYRLKDEDVEILRVFHQAQIKPSKWEQDNGK